MIDISNIPQGPGSLYLLVTTFNTQFDLFQTAFVVWANSELQQFVSRFSCQVFRREMDVAAIGVCVSMAKQQCEKVADSLYVTLTSYYH